MKKFNLYWLAIILCCNPGQILVAAGAFVHIEELQPGQVLYSKANVQEAFLKIQDKPPVAGQMSPFKLSKAFDVALVQYPGGIRKYVVQDGHHDILAAIRWYFEEQDPRKPGTDEPLTDRDPINTWGLKIPVHVTKVLDVGVDFWALNGRSKEIPVYLVGRDGAWHDPFNNFLELRGDEEHNNDYPLRYFVERAARKVKKDKDNPTRDTYDEGYRYPLWLKVDGGFPYIEFVIANMLQRLYGDRVITDADTTALDASGAAGAQPPFALVEDYRVPLREAIEARGVADAALPLPIQWMRMQASLSGTTPLRWGIPTLTARFDMTDAALGKRAIDDVVAAHRRIRV